MGGVIHSFARWCRHDFDLRSEQREACTSAHHGNGCKFKNGLNCVTRSIRFWKCALLNSLFVNTSKLKLACDEEHHDGRVVCVHANGRRLGCFHAHVEMWATINWDDKKSNAAASQEFRKEEIAADGWDTKHLDMIVWTSPSYWLRCEWEPYVWKKRIVCLEELRGNRKARQTSSGGS